MAIVIAGLVWRVIVLAKSRDAYRIELSEWVAAYLNLNEVVKRSKAQAKELMSISKKLVANQDR